MNKDKLNKLIILSYDSRGDIYQALGNYDKALRDFKNCEELSIQENDRLKARLNYLSIIAKMGEYDDAWKELDEIENRLEEFNSESKFDKEYDLLIQLRINIMQSRCDYEGSERILDDYLSQKKGGIKPSGLMYHKAMNKALQGRFKEALKLFLKLRDHYLKEKDLQNYGSILMNIGNVYSQNSNYPKAIEYYEKALKNHLKISAKPSLYHTYYNLSGTYYYTHDLSRSKEYAEKSLKIAEEMGDLSSVAYSYLSLGKLSFMNLDIKTSRRYFGNCLEINKKIRIPTLEIYAGIGLWEIYFYSDADYVRSEELLLHILKISEQINSPSFLLDSLQHFILMRLILKNYNGIGEYIERFHDLSNKYQIKECSEIAKLYHCDLVLFEEKDEQKMIKKISDLIKEIEDVIDQSTSGYSYDILLNYYGKIGNKDKYDHFFKKLEKTDFIVLKEKIDKLCILHEHEKDKDKKYDLEKKIIDQAKRFSLKHYLKQIRSVMNRK